MTAGADNVRYASDLAVIDTGELTDTRLSPERAAEWGQWVRDVMRAALSEGVDYGRIPGTGTKPAMFKSGGEMLLKAAGLGFTMTRLDDTDARDHQGITYRCTVVRGDTPVAVCDGYCGRDEAGRLRANWNTIVKMAQKRALVGAALNATASSGLFVADIDDDEPAHSPPPDDPLATGEEIGFLRHTIETLTDEATAWLTSVAKADHLPNINGGKFRRSHRDRLAWHLVVAQRIKPAGPIDDGEAA
jgi:hypothetical protein